MRNLYRSYFGVFVHRVYCRRLCVRRRAHVAVTVRPLADLAAIVHWTALSPDPYRGRCKRAPPTDCVRRVESCLGLPSLSHTTCEYTGICHYFLEAWQIGLPLGWAAEPIANLVVNDFFLMSFFSSSPSNQNTGKRRWCHLPAARICCHYLRFIITLPSIKILIYVLFIIILYYILHVETRVRIFLIFLSPPFPYLIIVTCNQVRDPTSALTYFL